MAIYHLNVSTGSKGGGQSAAAKDAYLEREEKYAKGKEEVAHIEHGNMPNFAQDPREYWRAADEFERSNARLYRQIEFALPIELTLEEQIALAHQFATEITGKEAMPYTLAIHKGLYDHSGKKSDTPENPHVHLIISERANDGIERSAETWFKRANKKHPEQGGAAKSKSMESREWLMETRELWANMANKALAQAGRKEKIDHRTLEAQGITDRLPQVHRGTAWEMGKRGIVTQRLEQIVQRKTQNRRLKQAQIDFEKVKEMISDIVAKAIQESEQKPEPPSQPTRPTAAKQATVHERAQEHRKQQIHSLRSLNSYSQLLAYTEAKLKEQTEAKDRLNHLEQQKNSLEKQLQSNREQYQKNAIALSQMQNLGFLGRWKQKENIAQLEQRQSRTAKQIQEQQQQLSAYPNAILQAQERLEQAKETFSLYSAALKQTGQAERLNGLPPQLRDHWKRREAEISAKHYTHPNEIIQQERKLNSEVKTITPQNQAAKQKKDRGFER